MRARQRHLNPASAAATIALDARFITGLNNNDAVTTWSTRTSNGRNATQSSASLKPTYLTAQQGGNPVVNFNLDYMTESTGVGGSTANFSAIIAFKSFNYNGNAGGGGAALSCGTSSTADLLLARTQSLHFAQFNNSADGSATVSDPGSGQQIQSYLYDGGGTGNSGRQKYFFNGAEQTLAYGYTVPATINPIGQYAIGAYSLNLTFAQWHLSGDMCSISIYPSSLSSSLRRRLENAAALSFKIACS